VFVVPDATQDSRFAGSPLVTGETGIRFYAGAPLVSPEGASLGALCVNDRVPRTLTDAQKKSLRILARQVMTHLELRRHTWRLLEIEERLSLVTEKARVGLVMLDRSRRYIYANPTYAEILNLPQRQIVGKTVAELLPEVYEDQIRPRLDRGFAGERLSYELCKPGPGGSHYYSVRYEPVPDGKEGEIGRVVVVITDITELKRAEAERERQRNELQLILDAVPALVFYKDTESRFVQVNREFTRMLGVTPESCVGKTDAEMGVPEGERYRRDDERIMRTGKPIRQQVEQIHTPQGVRWLLTDKLPHRDANGRVIGVIGLAVDITARKQVEDRLREREEQLRLYVEFSPASIAMFDRGMNYIAASRRWLDAYRLGGQPVAGRSHYEVFPEIPEKWKEVHRRCLQGEVVKCEEDSFVRGDGRTYWLRWEVRPWHHADGSIGGIIIFSENITERKEAEKALLESEEKFRQLAENITDVFWIRSPDQEKVQYASPGFERIWGHPVESLCARPDLWAAEVLAEDRGRMEEAYAGLRAGQPSVSVEYRIRRPDGGIRWVHDRGFQIRDAEGKLIRLIGIAADITERKKIEAQFLRAQRVESIGTLAGGLAHDLNNILAPIMMAVDMLRATARDPQTKGILDTVQISARRGADIVRQVLSFARGIEGQRVEIQPRHLLGDLEKIIRDTFPKDIRLEVSLPRQVWPVMGDPTQIHQILLNLCVNARDAMPGGGVLGIAMENCTIDEHYAAMNLEARPGRYVCIKVSDTGMGIAPELRDKIFEPFFTTKEPNKGTGLGLSTTLAIVKSHQGMIHVYSEVGQGTSFKVYLPAVDGLSGAGAGEKQPDLPRGQGETVLVVDDEASIRTITGQTLEAFGYRVLAASDGADAVARYAQHQGEIAVVLMDMMMPVMDGPATIHALMRLNPNVRIIAASGLHANEELARASSSGVRHFLAKPYTAETLLQILRDVLGR
jgi:PAS domain S-box-containing protein